MDPFHHGHHGHHGHFGHAAAHAHRDELKHEYKEAHLHAKAVNAAMHGNLFQAARLEARASQQHMLADDARMREAWATGGHMPHHQHHHGHHHGMGVAFVPPPVYVPGPAYPAGGVVPPPPYVQQGYPAYPGAPPAGAYIPPSYPPYPPY